MAIGGSCVIGAFASSNSHRNVWRVEAPGGKVSRLRRSLCAEVTPPACRDLLAATR